MIPYPDPANLQGLVRFRYRRPFSQHLLFGLPEPRAGRTFLADLLSLVTPASAGPDPAGVITALGITSLGLAALGVSAEIRDSFSPEFREGPVADSMGDFGQDSPEHWWFGQMKAAEIHLITHLWAASEADASSAAARVREIANNHGVRELRPGRGGTALTGAFLPGGRLHFGYRDGLTEPSIDWDGSQTASVDFRQVVLGYASDSVPSTPDSGPAVELARDGTYSFFRWIYQDVAAFNRWLEAEAERLGPSVSGESREEWLAAKVMGRWRDGTPLVLSPDHPDPSLAALPFGYADDREGLRCPVSAHIRVVNPRDQELNAFQDVPIVLRRGTPCGPPLEGTLDDGVERGLIGIFFCVNIRRQCYRLLSWMNRNDFSPDFAPGFDTQDPLGSRTVPNVARVFEIPTDGGPLTVGLTTFLRTRGTAFFLLPGVEGLRRLSEGRYSS